MTKKFFLLSFLLISFWVYDASAQSGKTDAPIVKISNGLLEGTIDPSSGVRLFKGIPFAQPPVGDLRWRAPQPVKNWNGIRMADHFGPKAMQLPVFSDMRFRTDSTSEDCLYLNVWAPPKSAGSHLPVLVYFFGGGFIAGDGSEWRYDGASLASKGIVVVTVNYRLGIFGFFAYPELTKESPHHSSGDYGLLDQNAALKWVHQNIAAFGGDPNKVTIGGESAGSISVFAQMASPLSKNLIAGAIGESGAMVPPTLPAIPLEKADSNGVVFANMVGAHSLAELRAIPAKQLLKDAAKPGAPHFDATIDGYFLPESPVAIFEAGKQAHVPLLVGWNSTEVPYMFVMRGKAPTPENYDTALHHIFGSEADEALKLFPGKTEEQVLQSATQLSSDQFIVFSTWKWSELQRMTGGNKVYRYLFCRARPELPNENHNSSDNMPPPLRGAVHSAEIEYALGNLATNKVYDWTPDDYKVSATMEGYFANFIKTGNPNGPGLPEWLPNTKTAPVHFMRIDVKSRLETAKNTDQFEFLNKWYLKK